jgi:hypothetical protein
VAPTVADLAQRFLAEHAEVKRKASTAKKYRRLLDHVMLPALGKKRVADHSTFSNFCSERRLGGCGRPG